MKIDGKVFCFFEQSGTFKNEFQKLGIPAEDYDIQNHFDQTNHVCDLFAEIETAYRGGQSVFDEITPDDLVLAFFPCIFFCQASQSAFRYSCNNYEKMDVRRKTEYILKRAADREYFYAILIKLFCVINERGLRMVVENPATIPHYLLFPENFVMPPTMIDNDRRKRGDYFQKPTAYWFVGCSPTSGHSYQKPKEERAVVKCKGGSRAGLCSEERSMISPDYARNFICDFILGKEQAHTERTLFDI